MFPILSSAIQLKNKIRRDPPNTILHLMDQLNEQQRSELERVLPIVKGALATKLWIEQITSGYKSSLQDEDSESFMICQDLDFEIDSSCL